MIFNIADSVATVGLFVLGCYGSFCLRNFKKKTTIENASKAAFHALDQLEELEKTLRHL